MRASSVSQRRLKSPAASRISQRTHTPEGPGWNNSIRPERNNSNSNNNNRSQGGQGRGRNGGIHNNNNNNNNSVLMMTQETPDRSTFRTNALSTPAAALSANIPPIVEPQIELMSQLQNVVIRLSQSAVGEKQRLSHMQQRIDAYVALVREQDRMIDELRGMNIRIQKEKDTLITFRQQSLNHDLYIMNNLENDGGIDEEVRRAFTQHENNKNSSIMSNSNNSKNNNSLGTMNSPLHSFVRSLVAQLRDERRKRLEVEEQSSRMIGEQQLTIQRLEDRLRLHNNINNSHSRGSFFGRGENLQNNFSQQSHSTTNNNEEENVMNTPLHFSKGIYHGENLLASETRKEPIIRKSSSPSLTRKVREEDSIIEIVKDVSLPTKTKTTTTTNTTKTIYPHHINNRDERILETNAISHMISPSSFSEDRGIGEVAITTGTPLSSARSYEQFHPQPHYQYQQQQEEELINLKVEVPLAIHGTSYEDAAAILSDIRKKHGL